MNAYFKGWLISGPRGPIGPDGNPIGTIISFMGTVAPTDYLVCDGTVYPIQDYPELASFFEKQFGSLSHFGGDGVITFAVPDLQNMFLRGYHGDSEEQLSGEIGEKQDATEHIRPITGHLAYRIPIPTDIISPRNIDAMRANGDSSYKAITQYNNSSENGSNYYTSRPVNTAVLYCIKAVESVPAENIYSEEEIAVGKWIDGKTIYQKTFQANSITNGKIIGSIPDIDWCVEVSSIVKSYNSDFGGPSVVHAQVTYNGNVVTYIVGSTGWTNSNGYVTVQYTKESE